MHISVIDLVMSFSRGSLRTIIIMGIVTSTITACETATPGFSQKGYFKANKHRIMTFTYPKEACADDIKRHGASRMYTPGRLLAVYYYPEGAPVPDVTLAQDVLVANDMIAQIGGYRYVFMRTLRGQIIFVDCEKNRKHDLCTK